MQNAVPQQSGTVTPSAVHELKTLVLSRYPGILIETAEAQRAEGSLAGVARDLQLVRYRWSVTTGLRRAREDGGAPPRRRTPPAR